jgi:fluoride exporter
MTVLWLVLGGVLGALCRYHLNRFVQSRFPIRFPLGTLVVNTSGSLILGLLVGLLTGHPLWPVEGLRAFVGIGFCAAYTTFSSFAYETLLLWREGGRRSALINLIAQPVLGLLAAWVGLMLAW